MASISSTDSTSGKARPIRGLNQFGGIFLDIPLQTQIIIETSYTGYQTRLGTRRDSHVVQFAQQSQDIVTGHPLDFKTMLGSVLAQVVYVDEIAPGSVLREASFEQQMAGRSG